MKKKIEDIFPLLQVTPGGLVISKNADLTYCYEVEYPEVFVTGEQNYSVAFESFMNAARSLGEGFIIHKQDFFVEDRYKPDFSYNHSGDEVIRENEKHFKDRPFVNHRGFIYITLPASDPLKRDSAASSLFKKSLLPRQFKDQNLLNSFIEKVSSFVSAINQSRVLKLNQLNREAIVGDKNKPGVLQYYFTLSFSDTNIYDINRENSNFKIGNKNSYTFKINDLDQFPNELHPIASFRDFSSTTPMPISFGMAFGMNLPFNHIYNQVFYVTKQSQLITDKVSETKRHYSFSQWSRDNTFSMEQKTKFVDTMKHGELAVKAHFNIQIFHEDPDVLNQYKEATSGAIANAQFTSKIATAESEQIYWSCIPGNAQELGFDNYLTCLLSNAISMLSLETNYRSSPYQPNGLLLTDRFGIPRVVDLFFRPREEGLIDNRNFTIIGPSGSGKSFANNNLINYLRFAGAHVTIVDIGYSYRKLGQCLNAKYIEHTEDNPISLNPFYTNVDTYGLNDQDAGKLNEEFKQVIVQLLFLLYKNDQEPVTKAEEVTLLNMVDDYYQFLGRNHQKFNKEDEKYIKACFNSFYDFVRDEFPNIFKQRGGREDKEFDIKNFLFVLSPFYRGGQYDYLLNGEEEIELSQHPFVIYELDNIRDNKVLLPIITLMITNTYITKLFEVRGVLKVLLIEEAWKAISSNFFANFLLWAFKTARKHFGAIGVITQEIEDLLKSEVIKDTIIQNTDIKIIMDIKKYEENPEFIFSLFKISTQNIPQIFSINKTLPQSANRGKFKELAIILGKSCKIYGTEVSRYGYALFTTEPGEVDEIKKISKSENVSMYEASLKWADMKN